MRLAWDQTGERVYETGVDHGVLYIPTDGTYDEGVAWNGLVSVTESPSGAEATPLWADNIKYLNLVSREEFGATIEAYTYPDEFGVCDGTVELAPGVRAGQQNRHAFGLCYRSRIGNDEDADAGYKLHLVYGALAAPSDRAYATVNDTPEAITFSWTVTTTPVDVTGHKPTAILTINSTEVDPTGLAALEDELYGTSGSDPRLPLPDEVAGFFTGSVTVVETVTPTYNPATHVITIPTVTGVEYLIDGEVVAAGAQPAITEDTVVRAQPTAGHQFSETSDDDWTFSF